jgi:hypothetical protein
MAGVRKSNVFSAFSVSFAAGFLCVASNGAAQGVTIELEGEVPVSCRIEAGSAEIHLGALERTGETSFPFRLRCNTPFIVRLGSRNGAFAVQDSAVPPAGFTTRIAYHATVNITTSSGPVVGNCTSASLGESSCAISSRDGIALIGESALILRWDAAGREPVAGVYTDVLTMTINPRM